MNHVSRRLLVLAMYGASAVSAQDMTPGLWELNGRFTSDSGQVEAILANVEKSLARLPPERRKQLQGHSVGLHKGTVRMRLCVTPENARAETETAAQALHQDNPTCQLLSDEQGANVRTQVHLCEAPLLELERRWTTDPTTGLLLEAATTRLMELELAGSPERVRAHSQWKRISSSCRNVRPASASTASAKAR